jgi:hypothetical protein
MIQAIAAALFGTILLVTGAIGVQSVRDRFAYQEFEASNISIGPPEVGISDPFGTATSGTQSDHATSTENVNTPSPSKSNSYQTTNSQKVKQPELSSQNQQPNHLPQAPTAAGAAATSLAASNEPGRVLGASTERATSAAFTGLASIFGSALEALETRLNARINSLSLSTPLTFSGPAASTPVSVATFAHSQRIDELGNVTITNATVSGVIGLTDADIPDGISVSNYLPLSGGTLTGDLSLSGTLTAGSLSVAGVSSGGAIAAPYFTATSSTVNLLPFASSTAFSSLDGVFVGRTATTTIRGDGIASSLPFASTTMITATTASSTNLWISGVVNALLKTTSGGQVAAAVAGSDYVTGAGLTAAYPFPSNATTTILKFSSGLLSLASTTIGNGTQTGGLTIDGGATTTGGLLVQGAATSTITGPLSFGNDTLRAYTSGKLDIGDFQMGGKALNVYTATAGTVAAFQNNGTANGNSLLTVSSSAVTGSVNAFNATVSASGNLYAYLDNSGAGNTVYRALVEGAGDPKSIYEINGAQTWAVGADNSDSDSFKISGSSNLGTSDFLTITTGGNVGIGTTSPGQKLSVAGDILGNNIIGSHFTATSSSATSTHAGGATFATSGGNVGIGIASPTALLEVNGVVQSDRAGVPTQYLSIDGGNVTGPFIKGVGANKLLSIQSLDTGATGNTMAFFTNTTASPLEVMKLTAAGNVGIGTTTPWGRLSITAASDASNHVSVIQNAAGALQLGSYYGSDGRAVLNNNAYDAFGSTYAAQNGDGGLKLGQTGRYSYIVGGNNLLLNPVAGKVGVATTSPWRTLSVTGTVGFDGLTGATGAGSLCLDSNKQVVYNSASDNCLSSTRATKHAMEGLSIDGLRIIDALQPVSFIYNEGDGRTRYGFIAEDTAAVDAHLATYNASGTVSGIDDRSIIAVLVSAVKHIWAQVTPLVQSDQGQNKRIEQLEEEVAALKSAAGALSAGLRQEAPSGSSAPDNEVTDIATTTILSENEQTPSPQSDPSVAAPPREPEPTPQPEPQAAIDNLPPAELPANGTEQHLESGQERLE